MLKGRVLGRCGSSGARCLQPASLTYRPFSSNSGVDSALPSHQGGSDAKVLPSQRKEVPASVAGLDPFEMENIEGGAGRSVPFGDDIYKKPSSDQKHTNFDTIKESRSAFSQASQRSRKTMGLEEQDESTVSDFVPPGGKGTKGEAAAKGSGSEKIPLFYNVPVETAPIVVGRQQTLIYLYQQLLQGARTIVLAGPDGIGKTTLANVFAEAAGKGGRFTCVQWFNAASLVQQQMLRFLNQVGGRKELASLFVFDDVRDFNAVKRTLPEGGYALLTCRTSMDPDDLNELQREVREVFPGALVHPVAPLASYYGEEIITGLHATDVLEPRHRSSGAMTPEHSLSLRLGGVPLLLQLCGNYLRTYGELTPVDDGTDTSGALFGSTVAVQNAAAPAPNTSDPNPDVGKLLECVKDRNGETVASDKSSVSLKRTLEALVNLFQAAAARDIGFLPQPDAALGGSRVPIADPKAVEELSGLVQKSPEAALRVLQLVCGALAQLNTTDLSAPILSATLERAMVAVFPEARSIVEPKADPAAGTSNDVSPRRRRGRSSQSGNPSLMCDEGALLKSGLVLPSWGNDSHVMSPAVAEVCAAQLSSESDAALAFRIAVEAVTDVWPRRWRNLSTVSGWGLVSHVVSLHDRYLAGKKASAENDTTDKASASRGQAAASAAVDNDKVLLRKFHGILEKAATFATEVEHMELATAVSFLETVRGGVEETGDAFVPVGDNNKRPTSAYVNLVLDIGKLHARLKNHERAKKELVAAMELAGRADDAVAHAKATAHAMKYLAHSPSTLRSIDAAIATMKPVVKEMSKPDSLETPEEKRMMRELLFVLFVGKAKVLEALDQKPDEALWREMESLNRVLTARRTPGGNKVHSATVDASTQAKNVTRARMNQS